MNLNNSFTKRKNQEVEKIVDRLKQHLRNARDLKTPKEDTEREIVSITSTESIQRTLNKTKLNSVWDTAFNSFLASVEDLENNLNYNRSLGVWEKFYVFPSDRSIARHMTDEDIEDEDLICNKNKSSMNNLVSELIKLRENHSQISVVKYLIGNTGVGKTTFLKYFTKKSKDRALKSNLIVSRIKFRDVQDLAESNLTKENIRHCFAKQLVNCLVRDIFDSVLRANKILKKDQATTSVKLRLIELVDVVDTLCNIQALPPESSTEEIEKDRKDREASFDRLVNKLANGSLDARFELNSQTSIELIDLVASSKFNFCVILDGFDAINPDDLIIFGDDNEEGNFFDCLASAIRNTYSDLDEYQRCISGISKVFLVAARPTTIAQVEKTIERETHNDQFISVDYSHVVGTDIYKLVDARLDSKIHGGRCPGLDKTKVSTFLKSALRHIVAVLEKEHSAVQKGRFVDLFNHNIREKIAFIQEVLGLLIYKVDLIYVWQQKKLGYEKPEILTLAKFQEILEDSDLDVILNIYEVERLLILNKFGNFSNYYEPSKSQRMEALKDVGQFDNLFRYYDDGCFKPDVPNSDDADYEYKLDKDPILEKVWLLYFLNREWEKAEGEPFGRKLNHKILRASFKENFKHARCREHVLKMLIRGGLINVSFSGGDLFFEISPKGRFAFNDLLRLNIYVEYAVFSTKIPNFIAKKIRDPLFGAKSRKPTDLRRAWGRSSIANISIFLYYLKAVTLASVKPDSAIRKDLVGLIEDKMQKKIHNSFRRMIAKGMIAEPNAYIENLNTQLDLIDIGR